MKYCYLLLLTVLTGFASQAQTCSTTNATNCKCLDSTSSNCDLLPDIIMSDIPLRVTGTTGVIEYPQTGAGVENGRLRVSVSTPNVGHGNLEVRTTSTFVCGTDTVASGTTPCPDGSSPRQVIVQRVYHKNGATMTYYDRFAGYMTYHPTHGHMHVDDWGIYTLRRRDSTIADPWSWPLIGSGAKLGFCLMDYGTCTTYSGHCHDSTGATLLNGDFPNFGLGGGRYNCSSVAQGISSGYTDIYYQHLDGMYINIPPNTCNGDYFIVVKIDPHNYFLEEREDNNLIVVPYRLTQQTPLPGDMSVSSSDDNICEGGTVTLTATAGATSYHWNTGDTTPTINVTRAGTYTVDITNVCGSATKSITTNMIPNHISSITTDSACIGSPATLSATGVDSLRWYLSSTGGSLLGTGNTYTTPALTSDATYYVEAYSQTNYPSIHMGPVDSALGGGSLYSGDQYMIFDAYKDITIKTVKVYTGSSGNRTIELRNSAGTVINSATVNLGTGMQVVTLNFNVTPGTNYRLGWTAGSSPNWYRNSVGAVFPYTATGLASITNSSAGGARYYCFYDWVIQQTDLQCTSIRQMVTAHANPLPSVNFTGLASSYSSSASPVTLTGSPVGGTFSGPGISGNQFNPSVAGVGGPYTITYSYTDANGCSNSKSYSVSVTSGNTAVLGISDVQKVSVFPNPTNGPFNVEIQTGSPKSLDFIITDAGGREVYIESGVSVANKLEKTFNLSELSKGNYFLKIRSGNESSIHMITLQ